MAAKRLPVWHPTGTPQCTGKWCASDQVRKLGHVAALATASIEETVFQVEKFTSDFRAEIAAGFRRSRMWWI
jgi:hypothetical protein